MNKKLIPLIILGIAILLLIAFWSSITGTIGPAQRGVVFYKFGKGLDTENVYNEGFYFIAPWNTMHVINVQEQIIEEKDMSVLSSNGLPFTVDVTARFRPRFNKIGVLYQQFREDYKNNMVIPEVRSAVRKIIGNYTVEELYSTKRNEIQVEISKATGEVLQENHIELKAILLRAIKLPTQIENAIKKKQEEKQIAEAMKYKLDREQKEAERIIIEAKGRAEANEIVTNSITPALLKWKGIEATLELAKSQNAKVVVVGSGKDGLPIILGDK